MMPDNAFTMLGASGNEPKIPLFVTERGYRLALKQHLSSLLPRELPSKEPCWINRLGRRGRRISPQPICKMPVRIAPLYIAGFHA
jgi:hypothetical protein